MNPRTSSLFQQVFGRFLIHLVLYPVMLMVASLLLLLSLSTNDFYFTHHPFQNAGGQHDQEFAPHFISTQFAYYALIPCWLMLGILTGVLFRAKRSSPLVRRCCLTLFSFWIFGLCLVDPWFPFVRSWAQWAPATAGLLCAIAICSWPEQAKGLKGNDSVTAVSAVSAPRP